MDTNATVEQVIKLYEAGCEMVRITARNLKESANLGNIRNELEKEGYNIPLIADVHFNPRVAEHAAGIVNKIRVNPGNYPDSRNSLKRLISICRDHGTVIRVGVNHGSLSERILNAHGNTAEGMVASAMEFLEICRRYDFHDIVVSMKSSHVHTMIRATLDLVAEMQARGMDYPVHLGVTEAGEGEDGRVRSAAGIGPLLAMGIGDTIRVSLTEDPLAEIPVATKLRDYHADVRKQLKKPMILDTQKKPDQPSDFSFNYTDHDLEGLAIMASSDISAHILNFPGNNYTIKGKSGKEYPELVLNILQATGVYISGTEYISCPSCGRTNFDIQSVLKEVKKHTRGLKNVRIAVMGCIVNGPGEMLDADYGYVGAGNGKVNLYYKGSVVQKAIPERDALEALLNLINDTRK
jgi:(E)-4-hydroxy-3-methylbut-2-enyl-diphosphate synthase